MKAAVYERYGPPEVVDVKEVPKPAPKEGDVLIKMKATTVSSGDRRARSLDVPRGFRLASRLFFGLKTPRQPILGTELAGDIESIGTGVTKFKVGDPVFAFTGAGMGCHAEYRCLSQDAPIVQKPANLSYEEAAALSFGGTTALHFLRAGNLQRGEHVLILGASGAVGVAAVQLAKHFGAEVTGVCSTANVELVKSLGADHVIDYTLHDFATNGIAYDVILDTIGTAPFSKSKTSLKEGGRLLLVFSTLAEMLRGPWISLTSDKKVVVGVAPERVDDLRYLAELAQAGEYKAIIDRSYPLAQIVEAHRYVDTGHKKGAVTITPGTGRAV